MDEGPFRASRPADRRPVTRSEPAYRQPEEPQQPRQEPQSASHTPSHRAVKGAKPARRARFPLILALVLLFAVIGGIVGATVLNKSGGVAIDSSKYQAVFFTNGQVYFGKLSNVNGEYLKLSDIYYLQTQATEGKESNPQATSNAQSDVQLIKLGEEIHGPEDEMVLSKQQLLFYENLKADGKVAQSIEAYKKSH